MGQLDGQVAIVTGGGRGIGKAIALELAREGADVCVTARSDDQVQTVAKEIADVGRNGLGVACDVSNRQSVESMVEQVAARFGRIDILVNNAGGGTERTKVGEDDPDEWASVIEINLIGTYYCSRAALPHLKASGSGRVINVGSGMGHQPRVGNSSYNVAKAGQWMLTRCLSMELWESGIAVNELVPGPVYTELTKGVFEADKPHATMSSEWVKQPEEVVPLAMFLATQGEHGPTGQSFSLARRPI